jgi:hypothetical protein
MPLSIVVLNFFAFSCITFLPRLNILFPLTTDLLVVHDQGSLILHFLKHHTLIYFLTLILHHSHFLEHFGTIVEIFIKI